MKQAKVGLSNLSPTDKVAKSLLVETMMTGNANFATPEPKVVDLATGRTALAAAITEAAGGDHAKIFARQVAEAALDDLLLRMALYVTNTAKGDEGIILSSGFEARKAPEPIGPLPAPENLSAQMGDFEGQVVLRWSPVRGVHEYHVYVNSVSPDDATKWQLVGLSTRARFTVNGLDPGKFAWFRTTASGTAGTSPVSDPAKGFAAPSA